MVGLRGQAGRHIRMLQNDPGVDLHRVFYPLGRTAGPADLPLTVELSDCLEADAIVVSSPTHAHVAQMEALRDFRGYILLEKPAASTLDGMQRLLRLPQALKSRTRVNFNFLFHDLACRVRELIVSPQMGKVYALDVHVSHGGASRQDWQGSWRLAGGHDQGFGALETVGIHFIQFALTAFGRCESAVVRTSALAGRSAAVDTGMVAMRMQGDVWVNVRCSYAAPYAVRFDAWGTNGCFAYDSRRAVLNTPRDTFDADGLFATPPVAATWDIDYSAAWDESLARAQRDLLDSARRGVRFDPAVFDRDVSAMSVLLDPARGC